MRTLEMPEFTTYEEEAEYWDNLDTASYMEDDGEWFQFETPIKRAIRVAILPDVVTELAQRAHSQGVSLETLVDVLLRAIPVNEFSHRITIGKIASYEI